LVEARAREKGVRLKLTGTIPHKDLPSYYHAMDAFVLPSLTAPGFKEQFGHVLIEAMICEVPVIGSDSGEIPNVIGNAGLVVPEGDAGALADALCRLIEDRQVRDTLGERGRRRVLEHYTHERIAQETHRIYRQLLSEDPTRD
jgi:glycosyltransferase involved in cell wall biosynthesis